MEERARMATLDVQTDWNLPMRKSIYRGMNAISTLTAL